MDKKLQMWGALNSPVSSRSHLWSQSNLVATGTDQPNPVLLSAAKADFHSVKRQICSGTSTTFYDNSFNAKVTSRTWTFQDGTPATSTDSSVSVTFSGAGWKKVSLNVGNSNGSDELAIDQYIYVYATTPTFSGLLYEGFESPGEVESNWIVMNQENNFSKWQLDYGHALTDNTCYKLNNFGNDNGDIDYFISPSVDLSNSGINYYLSFALSASSFTTRADSVNDRLKIYISKTCGATWQSLKTYVGPEIVTTGFNPMLMHQVLQAIGNILILQFPQQTLGIM